MVLPTSISDALVAIDYGQPDSVSPVAGGSISEAWQLNFADGRKVFVKSHGSPPPGFFEAEAQGLSALARTGAIRTPQPLAVASNYLAMEWLDGARARDYWPRFGEQLAGLHRHTAEAFGFAGDNYCGLTPQPNPQVADGFRYFREARLLYQGRLALAAGLLDQHDFEALAYVADHLEDWVPAQPASLLHGDLWSGNAHCGPRGEPVLVDPAAHFGWHEAELAMTLLFGGFPQAFYESYKGASQCDPEWASRADIYNLYHLLNHLNLFGGGYLGSVRSTLARYRKKPRR
ncbi:fructosamine kinase family protein [Marinobacter salicampi]|uniref:fructosamine kinase family protein n=1 Tax=Marinobacter salicampi TaxID=435907 RepID=UPI0014091B31|nr:fructosamine kinase family protein [Marinobacter salicampi]